MFTKILRRTCCLTTTSAAVSLSKHGIGYELLQPVTLQTPNRLRAPTALSLSKHRGVTSSYSLSLSKHRTCYELLQLCHSPNTEQDTSTYSLSLSNHRIGYQLLQLCHSPNTEQVTSSCKYVTLQTQNRLRALSLLSLSKQIANCAVRELGQNRTRGDISKCSLVRNWHPHGAECPLTKSTTR